MKNYRSSYKTCHALYNKTLYLINHAVSAEPDANEQCRLVLNNNVNTYYIRVIYLRNVCEYIRQVVSCEKNI